MIGQYDENKTHFRDLQKDGGLKGSDEFFTLYEDIEQELENYPVEQFRGKHVWCPCDSPASNFTRYFRDNFKRLGLKRLTSTCLAGQRYDYDGNEETITTLDNGDAFGGCVEDLWQTADIVITNPPFSRKFDFLGKLLDNNKQFLFLCFNVSAGAFDFLTAFTAGKLWLGQHNPIQFMCPDGSLRKVKV